MLLQVPLRQQTLAKLAVVIKSPEGHALERFIIEPKLLISTAPNRDAPADTSDILDLEAHLRAALLKLQYLDSSLPTAVPLGSSFEILAYNAGRSGLAVDAWISEDLPLTESGLEFGESGGVILPLKTVRIEHAVQFQLYIERPSSSTGGMTQSLNEKAQ